VRDLLVIGFKSIRLDKFCATVNANKQNPQKHLETTFETSQA